MTDTIRLVSVRVAGMQVDIRGDESVDARVQRVLEQVRALGDSADLVVLPELWHVGAFDLAAARAGAVPRDGALVAAMQSAALDAGVWLHAGSFAELDPSSGNRYNTSLLIDPTGKVVAWYRKQYLFGWTDGEPSVMTAGDEFVVVETPLGSTGLTTCYDLRFPEMYRELVDRGATAFLIPAGWPAARIAHWSVLVRARAIENQAWVIAVNTAGTHAGVEMGGHSVVVDPTGAVVAQAGTGEEVIRAEIDPAAAAAWRQSFPVLGDRR